MNKIALCYDFDGTLCSGYMQNQKLIPDCKIDVGKFWKEHLKTMSELRDIVAWRVYAQKDPFSEYLQEAFGAFYIFKDTFKYYTLFMVFRAIIV